MSFAQDSESKLARADVYPARFVSACTTEAGCVIPANNTPIIGVSGLSTNRVPLEGLDTGLHAANGGMVSVFTNPTKHCKVLAGANITYGDYLVDAGDGSGKAIPLPSSNGTWHVGAQAQASATNGTYCDAKPLQFIRKIP